jgi:hypothetical protein
VCTAVHPEIIEYAPLHSGRRAPWNDRANAAASLSVLIATLLEGISSGSKLNVAVPKKPSQPLAPAVREASLGLLDCRPAHGQGHPRRESPVTRLSDDFTACGFSLGTNWPLKR